jgi:hypothetical protein
LKLLNNSFQITGVGSTMKQFVDIDQLTPCHLFSQQLELKLTFNEKCTPDHLNPNHTIRSMIGDKIINMVSLFFVVPYRESILVAKRL